jgi:hypothetical protein
MFNYIFNGDTHTDVSNQYMLSIGMDDEQMASVIQQKEFETSQCHHLRKAAYAKESDPMFIEYDQTTGKELAWRNKVAEIKQRYPAE